MHKGIYDSIIWGHRKMETANMSNDKEQAE